MGRGATTTGVSPAPPTIGSSSDELLAGEMSDEEPTGEAAADVELLLLKLPAGEPASASAEGAVVSRSPPAVDGELVARMRGLLLLLLLLVLVLLALLEALACGEDAERGDPVDEGFANRTPSYWTPLNSIDTTSCWSPLVASPLLISLNCMPIMPICCCCCCPPAPPADPGLNAPPFADPARFWL